MKTPTLVMLATAVACAAHAAAAAECTLTQLNQISAVDTSDDMMDACGAYTSASMSTAVFEQMCYDTACLAVIRDSVAKYPSCTVSGYDVRSVVASIQSNCETIVALGTGVPTTRTPTTTSPPTLRTTQPTTRTSTPTTRTPTSTSPLFTPTPTSRKPTQTLTDPTPIPTTASASDTPSGASSILSGLVIGKSDANVQQQRASTALVATALAALVFTAFA